MDGDSLSGSLANSELFANLKDKEELISFYDKWSTNYDRDVSQSSWSYIAPSLSAKALSVKLTELEFPKETTRILDMASGTGLVGEALKPLGYTDIDALDGSVPSLEFSRKKGVYKNYIHGILETENSESLGVAADQYDAAVCVGTFTKHHVKSKGMDDLVHVVKPGGLVCFTIRDVVADDPEYGYDGRMKKLCEEKRWKLLHKSLEEYATGQNIACWLYIYQIM